MPKIKNSLYSFISPKLGLKQNQGFTLIELLIIVAVLGILSTVTLITLTGSTSHARDTRRMSDLKQYQTALETYYSSNDAYPTGTGSITDRCSDLGLGSTCPGDPKGSTYRYTTNGQQFTIDVELEGKSSTGGSQFFVVCSNGTSGIYSGTFSPSGGNCPSF